MPLVKENVDDKFYTAKNDNVFKSIFCDENNTFLLTFFHEKKGRSAPLTT